MGCRPGQVIRVQGPEGQQAREKNCVMWSYTPVIEHRNGKIRHLKMYFLLKMVIFQ